MTTDQQRLAEIAARAAARTPGYWRVSKIGQSVEIASDHDRFSRIARPLYNNGSEDSAQVKANAEFIAHTAADIDYLLAEVARLTTENAELTQLLDASLTREIETGLPRLKAARDTLTASRLTTLRADDESGTIGATE